MLKGVKLPQLRSMKRFVWVHIMLDVRKSNDRNQRIYCIDIENGARINMKLQLGHHHRTRSTQLDYEQRKSLGGKRRTKLIHQEEKY